MYTFSVYIYIIAQIDSNVELFITFYNSLYIFHKKKEFQCSEKIKVLICKRMGLLVAEDFK